KDLWLVEEEMVVQSRHFQALPESRVHGRGHFVLKDDRVAHHHGSVGSRRESSPRAKPGKWFERHAVYLDRDLLSRPLDANYASALDYGLDAGSIGDFLCVKLGVVLGVYVRCGSKGQHESKAPGPEYGLAFHGSFPFIGE